MMPERRVVPVILMLSHAVAMADYGVKVLRARKEPKS
jgi:hypothetical protein